MKSTKKEKPYLDNIWVISKGRYIDLDLRGICEGLQKRPVREYHISDLAKYMLNPNPIEVWKKLMGCEIHYSQPGSYKIKEKISQLLPKNLHGFLKGEKTSPDVIMSDFETKKPPMKDRYLESHFKKVHDLLRPYDSIFERLSTLDTQKISDVMGICEDIDGVRSKLNLQGSIEEKINYLVNFIMNDVHVTIEKAHVVEGLFEMRGFDFQSYDSRNSHKLMRFLHNGETKSCVLGPDNRVEYWIEDIKHVNYLHLLEQAIQTNRKFHDSLRLCAKGHAKPYKIFFNRQLEIDYSKDSLPEVYKEVFEMYNMGSDEKEALVDSLKNMQVGIAFNYVPRDSSEEEMYTNLSVMHDIRALEPIKDDLPQLYMEISQRASVSEAGRFYFLDSIRGSRNEQ